MAESLLFYDLETSGFNAREQRIMQFAGQRTDMQLKPIGEPFNYLIKMTEDILPDPEAVLLTGITPQATIADGISEAEFLKIFANEISVPGTVFVGFNSIRFDDEFMRFLHYRNFYDAYEWHWADGRGRWDMLDVVRMTRALRPEGIKWPVDSDGVPANRLELLTAINGLSHLSAHDALSDVNATIALAQLIRSKQPKLFKFLLNNRDKKDVAKIVLGGQPFVYTSGKYPSEFEKTTVAATVTEHPQKKGAIVYDLRHDPTPFFDLTPEQLAEMWRHYCKDDPCKHQRLPVKTLQFNRCPAVAPIGVFNEECQTRLQLPLSLAAQNLSLLAQNSEFAQKLIKAVELMDKKYQTKLIDDVIDADERLYDGFIGDKDKSAMAKIRSANTDTLTTMKIEFEDDRLAGLLPLYKARNYPKSLNDNERQIWQKFCERRLLGGKNNSRAAKFFEKLSKIAERPNLTDQQNYLLEELQLYAQSIIPLDS